MVCRRAVGVAGCARLAGSGVVSHALVAKHTGRSPLLSARYCFGFGTAQNLILLKERKTEALVQGVDIDPKIKSIAEYKLRKRSLEVPLHLYDGTTLPFADNFFNIISSKSIVLIATFSINDSLGQSFRLMGIRIASDQILMFF